jgi:hypothetical protein
MGVGVRRDHNGALSTFLNLPQMWKRRGERLRPPGGGVEPAVVELAGLADLPALLTCCSSPARTTTATVSPTTATSATASRARSALYPELAIVMWLRYVGSTGQP